MWVISLVRLLKGRATPTGNGAYLRRACSLDLVGGNRDLGGNALVEPGNKLLQGPSRAPVVIGIGNVSWV